MPAPSRICATLRHASQTCLAVQKMEPACFRSNRERRQLKMWVKYGKYLDLVEALPDPHSYPRRFADAPYRHGPDFVAQSTGPIYLTTIQVHSIKMGPGLVVPKGRVQQWSEQPKTPNVAKRGTVWTTRHWWIGRPPKLGCDGPKLALPLIL